MNEIKEQASLSSITPGMYNLLLLFRFKYWILSIVLIITGLSIILSLYLPNYYTALVNVVPPKSGSTGMEGAMGNITSALREFGMTQVGGKTEGYSLMAVLKSRSLLDSIIINFDLINVYKIKDSSFEQARLELDDNMEITIEKNGNYTIYITDISPVRAAEIANKTVDYANKIAVELSQRESTQNRKYMEDRLNVIDSTIKALSEILKNISSEKLIFSPLEQARSISTALSELKAKKIENEIYLDLFRQRFGENDYATKLQSRLVEQFTEKLKDAETKPGFAGNFTIKEAAGVGINYLKIYTEIETYSKVKAALMPMFEKMKLDEVRSAENFYFLDKAIPPEKKSKPKRSLIIIGAFVSSLILTILVIFLIDSLKRVKVYYKKFKSPENLSTG
ncbi:MAG: lipopolysaccharide biosynthesis protein [Ignavibacteria bacterium]|nr:lipopolysaccharide biosynthesis protein [Ignavibacteria bacterium]